MSDTATCMCGRDLVLECRECDSTPCDECAAAKARVAELEAECKRLREGWAAALSEPCTMCALVQAPTPSVSVEPEYGPDGWIRQGVLAICPECKEVKEGTIAWHLKHESTCAWKPAGTWFAKRLERELAQRPSEASGGEWKHCSPELLASGIDCGATQRRSCECGPDHGSHDHLVPRTNDPQPPAADACTWCHGSGLDAPCTPACTHCEGTGREPSLTGGKAP